MKHLLKNHSSARYHCLSLALAASLAVPLPALAASVSLATAPLATTTTSTVKPNLLLLMDNSGSMEWDHMPDDSSDNGSAVTFQFGYYGLRSSQCNQVYYNPAITYAPPVYSDGTSYPNATFSAAKPDGYKAATSGGTNDPVNLNSAFKASKNLNEDASATSAYYYTYSGAQTTQLLKYYHSTTNAFYKECNAGRGNTGWGPVNNVTAGTGALIAAATGSTAPPPTGSGVFTKVRLAETEKTTLVVAGTGGTTSGYAQVSGITVNGKQIMKAASVSASGISSTTMATNIAAQINLCTAVASGNCTTTGYSASVSGSTITITNSSGTSASGYTPIVTFVNTAAAQRGTITVTPDIFPDTTAAKLTNFANWYSYYRTRMLMMKTATGRAFTSISNAYRVGLMKISSSTPVHNMATYESTSRDDWYTALYAMTSSGSTPLRTALSNAGRYFAGQIGTDPLQYSCQQNFTILSTDGYWNTGDGYMMDGSTTMDNQDSTAGRPMFDGTTITGTTVTTTYSRNDWEVSASKIGGSGSNCASGKSRLLVTPQTRSCSITTPVSGVPGAETCTAWANGSKAYVSPYTSNSTSCKTSATVTAEKTALGADPSNPVATGTVTSTVANGGSSNSLADVAMYYYQNDLRTTALGNCTGALGGSIDVCDNNVFISSMDNNTKQHMTTFTLGLGASGWMNYSTSYLSDPSGHYYDVKLGSTADSTATPPVCPWQANGTVCNWPLPGMDASDDGYIANIDDLWHAAVNGRGAYFSATDPATLSTGLANALSGIKARKGSSAAAATSTLNPVPGNNFAYVASYTTVSWKGNLEARGINTNNGDVNENATWCVENVVAGSCAAPSSLVPETAGDTTTYYCVTPDSVICTDGVLDGTNCKVPVATSCTGTMNSRVTDISDTRVIKTANSAGTALIDFDAAYAAANPSYFEAAHISTLTQWASLDTTQRANAEGANLVKYLRGQYGYEDRTSNVLSNRLYRYREAVMGDALESQPAYISKPVFSYIYPGYSAYVTAQASRSGTVYIGANDGMMHAFAADTGAERWAYVPSMVIPNMWKLADTSYDTKHVNFVNGSPVTTDICAANCTDPATAVWKTILVAGLNGGGRGYYALDITDPDAPALLWEFTTMSGVGALTGHDDDDLGYSFGRPAVTRKSDGTWVVLVTSGYNNTSPGDGKGYLYVLNAATGALISKIATGAGSTTTPSGLAKIAIWNDESGGNKAGYIYGGDLLGNVWRFDINSSVTAAYGTGDVMKFAALYSDAAGTSPQPITTTPVLGEVAGKRVIFIGTGKYLEGSDLTNTQLQTQYAIKDDNEIATLVNPRNTLVQQTLSNNPDGTATRISSNNTVNFSTGRGWYMNFPDSKERVNIDSRLDLGILVIPTIVPSNTACSPGGYSWFNFVDYKTGAAINADGLVATKIDATIVGVNLIYVHGDPIYLIVTSADPTPKRPDVTPEPDAEAGGFVGKRVIWRELIP